MMFKAKKLFRIIKKHGDTMRNKRSLDQFEQARRSIDTMFRFVLLAAFAFLAFVCFCVYKLLSFFGVW